MVEPISSTCTRAQWPMSSGVGGSIRTSVLAPVVLQMRRSSNLDGHFITMIACFSQKWSASSPTAWPHTIMLTPVAAMALMIRSSASSSESLYRFRSSADLSSTVPLVSVVAESSGIPYTASFAPVTCERASA